MDYIVWTQPLTVEDVPEELSGQELQLHLEEWLRQHGQLRFAALGEHGRCEINDEPTRINAVCRDVDPDGSLCFKDCGMWGEE